jgi:hypothetical protein
LSVEAIQQSRRTFDSAQRVELAAIGVTGLALHYLAKHEIRDVTARGSGADYLVDEELHRLEIAGRSRKADLPAAWNDRKRRLARNAMPYVLSVVEFETPAARLGFFGE